MTKFNFNLSTIKKNVLVTIVFILHMFVQAIIWYLNNKSFNIIVFVALLIGFDYITDKIEAKFDVKK
jgi:hypothetical protein